MNRVLIFAAALTVALSGCGEKAGPPKPDDNALSGTNKWIREQLEQWYYWRDALVSSTPPSNSLSYSDFVERSLIDLGGAKDADGTMDGGYMNDGSRYLYSRIDRISGGTRASDSEQTTFGFGVIIVKYGNTLPTQYAILVTWVLPGGPADKAGLKRGMVLNKYNDKTIYAADVDTFAAQLFSQSAQTMVLTSDRGGEFSFAGESTRIDPILVDKVITTAGGEKVAYLMYNAFEQGQTTDSGGFGEFDRELRYVFGSFGELGATELVLDLRYNGGGAVISSQLLSSLAGNVDNSKVFAKMLYNSRVTGANPRVWYFMNEPTSMKLNRVYVLVTSETASSSELFINSLRGVGIDVVLIGKTTEGKNVGMNLLEHTEGIFRYEFWPITFKSSNAAGFDDYSEGFAPDVSLDELQNLFGSTRGELYGFGDERETLLRAALTMIDGGSVSSEASTRAPGLETITLSDPRSGGARIYNSPDGE